MISPCLYLAWANQPIAKFEPIIKFKINTMKKYIILIFYICCVVLSKAQPVCYDYDASGNRIARFDCNPVADCPCDNGGQTIGDLEGGMTASTLLSDTPLFQANPDKFGNNDEQQVCITVSGEFILDRKFTFENVEFKMQPGSRITVTEEATFENCYLHSCEIMWAGIVNERILYMYNTTVEDAYRAITFNVNTVQAEIRHNIFNKNEFGIYYDGGDNGIQPFGGVDVVENTFKCDAGLLDHWSHNNGTHTRTTFGVDARNAFYILGSYTPADRNIFTGIWGGIRSINSNAIIINAKIEQMANTTYKAGTLPYPAYGYANDIGILARFGYLNVIKTEISEVERGIDVQTVYSVGIENSKITSDAVGIYADDLRQDYALNMGGNEINATLVGLSLNKSQNANVKIQNQNKFTTLGKANNVLEQGYGIRVSSLVGSTKGAKVIDNNTFNFVRDYHGISINNDGRFFVQNNRMTVGSTGNSFKTTRGIYLEKSSRNRIIADTIIGPNTWGINTRSIAFLNDDGQHNSYCCNETTQLWAAFHYMANSENNKVKYNSIGNHYLMGGALAIYPGTTIGRQINHWNKWVGTYLNPSKMAASNGNSLSPTLLANSAFEIAQATGNVWNPNPNFIKPTTGWFNTTTPYLTPETCQNTFTCKKYDFISDGNVGIPSDEGALAEASALAYVTQRYTNESFGAYNTWTGSREVLRSISINPTLLNNTTLNTFYLNNQASNIKKLNQIDDKIANMYEPTAVQKTTIDEINSEVKQIDTRLLELIQELSENPTNSALKTEKKELMTNKSLLLTRLGEYQTTIQLASSTKIEEARAINTSIIPQNEFDRNEKTINDIFFNSIALDISIDEAQQATIRTIAGLCPMIGGTAVFKARHLMGYFADASFDDIAICFPDQIGPDNEGGKIIKPQNPQAEVLIYPNPAQDEVTIVVNQNEPVMVNIIDITGKVVMQQSFSATIQLSTANIPNGSYFCEIWKGKERLSVQQLSVIH